MNKEELEKLKKEAEEYVNNTLVPQREQIANAVQQVIGRVQMLQELIDAETASTDKVPDEPVAIEPVEDSTVE